MARRRFNSITFEHYESNTADFAYYPHHGERDAVSLAYCGLALTGEAGEVADSLKKALRDENLGHQGRRLEPERRRHLAEELGDVLFYAARLADELGYSLGDVARMSIDKLDRRTEVLAAEGHPAAKTALRRRRARRSKR